MFPSLGAAGKYTVASPYTIEDKSYVCRGVNYITALTDKGIDVFTDYYDSVWVSVEQYNQDVRDGQAIITLVSEDGDELNIPNSFLTERPTQLEVPYSRFGILVELGELPDTTALSYLRSEFEDLALSITGNESHANLAVLPMQGFVTNEDHKVRVATRETNKNFSNSPRLRVVALEEENQSLRQKIEALEEYIKNLP